MKNALIINGGDNTTNRDQIEKFDYIVAVDSGAMSLNAALLS